MIAGLALGLIPGVVLAQWEAELKEQISFDEGCEVSFLSQVVEREVDGSLVIIAKVHCVDKRTFDAMRHDDYAPFEFKLCGQENVSAC
ncbi:MAG: hypothetical protein MI920_22710 [Kiloniellales bacterium]|nr:hypothetical protein [Kiloniellales bacterium]